MPASFAMIVAVSNPNSPSSPRTQGDEGKQAGGKVGSTHPGGGISKRLLLAQNSVFDLRVNHHLPCRDVRPLPKVVELLDAA